MSEIIIDVEKKQATMYQGEDRRYFTKNAALRSYARKVLSEYCDCEPPHYESGYAGKRCDCHPHTERGSAFIDFCMKEFKYRLSVLDVCGFDVLDLWDRFEAQYEPDEEVER